MFLPYYAKCDRFINADLIAAGLSPFLPQRVALKSGKIVLEYIKMYSDNKVNFGFETTLAGVTYLKYFKMLKERGYAISIFFLWISSPQLAIVRIKDRVAQGGHHVAIKDIHRRFTRSMRNFFTKYQCVADRWILFDNSDMNPRIIARRQNKQPVDVIDRKLFLKITKPYL